MIKRHQLYLFSLLDYGALHCLVLRMTSSQSFVGFTRPSSTSVMKTKHFKPFHAVKFELLKCTSIKNAFKSFDACICRINLSINLFVIDFLIWAIRQKDRRIIKVSYTWLKIKKGQMIFLRLQVNGVFHVFHVSRSVNIFLLHRKVFYLVKIC